MKQEYSYRALGEDGTVETGKVWAIDIANATAEVYAKGIRPVEISKGKPTWRMRLNEPVTFFEKPNNREIQRFLRDLARLLDSGLALDVALQLLLDMQGNKYFEKLIFEMKERVRQGAALHEVLAKYPDFFPVQICAAIQAGENAGELVETLHVLSSSLDKALTFKERLRAALIYPAILTLMVVATFVLVVGFVLPQFKPIFVGNEERLPGLTRGVMWLGDFLTAYGGVFSLFLISLIFLAVVFLKDPVRRVSWYRFWTQFRLFHPWMITPNLLRFIRTLGICSKSGLPLDKALALAIETVNLPHLSNDLAQLRNEIRRGSLLSTAFEARSWLPALVLQFSRVGEETGELGEMLVEAAGILSDEYEAKLEKALTVLSPVLTLVMGAIVALLVGSVLMGIMSVNNVAI